MSFSISTSGPLQEVISAVTSQAEQYADQAVGHVADFLHNLAQHLDQGNGVSLSASGHSDGGQVSASINAYALPAPAPENTPEAPAAPVS